MNSFVIRLLPEEPTVTAPDGSEVRTLVRSEQGSMAHFQLAPGRCSVAIRHRIVEELWYVIDGEALMFSVQVGGQEAICRYRGNHAALAGAARGGIRCRAVAGAVT